jgi:cobaltochelatase CobT
MKTQPQVARETVQRALLACARAVAADRNMEDAVSPGRAASMGLAVARGISDACALRHVHHDARLHARLAPLHEWERALYDALEQVRVDAIGSLRMRGVALNLAAALEHALSEGEATAETALGLMLRTRLTGEPPPASGGCVLTRWEGWVQERFSAMLEVLPDHLYQQAAFASVVTRHLGALATAASPHEQTRLPTPDPAINGTPSVADQADAQHDGGGNSPGEATERAEAADADEPADLDRDDIKPLSPARLRAASMGSSTGSDYHVFTTEFDQIANARELRSPHELQRLRGVLDRHRGAQRVTVGRLAARLQRHLLARQQRAWAFDLEEGELDTARLARIIIDPTQSLSFKQECESRFRDTAVTLLIDNSGSMHGRPIAVAAVCCEILAATLERCGVTVEVLGFTTGAWNGGQPRAKWLKAGKPAAPGRLNQTSHIIYKSAQQPLRHARSGLGLMLCNELLKENIDGEALLWAQQRLLTRPEQRKVLMVVCDGAPADDATLSANPRDYLERHLRAAIHMIGTHSPVELVAIGMGHDVGRYYPRAVAISEPEELPGALTDELDGLLLRRRSRRHHCVAGATSSRSTR